MTLHDLNVLIIEDDLELSESSEACLKETFHESFHTNNLVVSIKIFQDIFIDFILVNVDHPGLQGIKFVSLLKKKIPSFPIAAVSASTDETFLEKLDEWKIDRVVPHPLTPEKVNELIVDMKEEILAFAQQRPGRNIAEREQSLTAQEAIKEYFTGVNIELMKYDKEILSDKEMDFSIMKSFVFTAYNNLKSIDFNITFDERLKLANKKLDRAINLKKSLEAKTAKSIEDNYEVIFLMNQVPYVKLHKEREQRKESIYKSSARQEQLAKKMDLLKLDMKKLSPDSPAFAQMDTEYKRLHKENTDLIHAIREEKDRVEAISEQIDLFKAEHFADFKAVYLQEVGHISTDVNKTLNVLMYHFDKELWRVARKSRMIKEHFKEAKIQGLFSSRTYSKYYTKNIDINLASENMRKLMKYLDKYSKENQIAVAIVGNDTEWIQKAKEVTEKIDSAIKVVGYLNPELFISQYEAHHFDILIVDLESRGFNGIEFIKEFQKKVGDKTANMTFCLNLPSASYPVSKIDRTSITIYDFFHRQMSRDEIAEKMIGIL